MSIVTCSTGVVSVSAVAAISLDLVDINACSLEIVLFVVSPKTVLVVKIVPTLATSSTADFPRFITNSPLSRIS